MEGEKVGMQRIWSFLKTSPKIFSQVFFLNFSILACVWLLILRGETVDNLPHHQIVLFQPLFLKLIRKHIFPYIWYLWYLILFFLMISYWGSSSFTIGLTDWNYIYLHVHTQSFYGFQSLHHLHVIHEVQNTFDQILGWKKSFSRCPSAAPALWGKFLKESHPFYRSSQPSPYFSHIWPLLNLTHSWNFIFKIFASWLSHQSFTKLKPVINLCLMTVQTNIL